MRPAVIAMVLIFCSAALAQIAAPVEEVATMLREYHPQGSPPVRENPSLQVHYYRLPDCAMMYARGSFTAYNDEAGH